MHMLWSLGGAIFHAHTTVVRIGERGLLRIGNLKRGYNLMHIHTDDDRLAIYGSLDPEWYVAWLGTERYREVLMEGGGSVLYSTNGVGSTSL
jgi:hypothetical protein